MVQVNCTSDRPRRPPAGSSGPWEEVQIPLPPCVNRGPATLAPACLPRAFLHRFLLHSFPGLPPCPSTLDLLSAKARWLLAAPLSDRPLQSEGFPPSAPAGPGAAPLHPGVSAEPAGLARLWRAGHAWLSLHFPGRAAAAG